MKANVTLTTVVLLLATGLAACNKVPLLAPTNSTISLSASTKVLPLNGTTGLTVFVTESSGTPVQNGTTVRFTTTLGAVQPAEVQTTNGLAVTTFVAGSSSGVAEVRAFSGGSATGGTTTTAGGNVVSITVGTAAVTSVTLRANPSTVGATGGAVDLVAIVLADSGNGLAGIPVSFTADQGSLAQQTVVSDANGESRTTLTTSLKTIVTASAGTKTSSAVTVDVRAAPGVSITCAVAAGTGSSCASIQATAATNTVATTFTVTKASGTSALRDSTIDFGDGITQSLGTLLGGAATVAHTYAGPSGASSKTYTATVRAVDINGEVTTASVNVTVTARANLTVDLTATGGTAVLTKGKPYDFVATVAGGDAQSYAWDFTDGTTVTTAINKASHVFQTNGIYIVTVTVTTSDGRTAVGRVEFIVTGV